MPKIDRVLEKVKSSVVREVGMMSQHSNGSNFLSSGSMDRTFSRTSSIFDESYKIINDPIHGHIKLDQDTIDFIDTVQFQRLRDLKQVRADFFFNWLTILVYLACMLT
jgi:hypothetical protein